MADWLRFLLAVLPGLAPAVASDADWPSYANDAASTKCAPLDQINAGNVHQLGAVWSWASPDNALGMFPGPFDGRDIKAVAQVTKQGFVFVFDRVTGEPVWPIEERAGPRSTVPGERTSPTQPCGSPNTRP